jgi:tetratricopeptide (TPR) repeat protein
VGYFLFSLTDHQLDLPIFAAIATAGLAAVGSGTPRELALPRAARAVIALGGAALVALPAIALARDLLARREFDRALNAMERSDTPAVLAALDHATGFMPADSFFQHTAADWAVRQRAKQKKVEDQSDMTRAAVMRLEKSLRTGVHLEYAHFNLGWLLLNADRPRDAAAHFLATARLVPDKGGVYFGLGLALQAMRREADAIHAFALEWVNDPRQFTSPSWEVPALARLKPAIRTEALELLSQAAHDYPDGRAAATWARWWLGDTIAPAQLTLGFSIESTAFAGLLNNSSQPGYPWAILYAAWQRGAGFESPALTHGESAFAAALARRAQRYRGDFREFLTAPVGEEGALALTYQRQRRGYGVLASHPDAPLLTDAYVVQENRIIAELAPNLFPPKGWLPGRFLLAMLKENPR